jgi:hypothetical protein
MLCGHRIKDRKVSAVIKRKNPYGERVGERAKRTFAIENYIVSKISKPIYTS